MVMAMAIMVIGRSIGLRGSGIGGAWIDRIE